jgi:HK97 family phage major capsid protein
MTLMTNRADLVTSARAFLDSKTVGGKTLSADDTAAYENMEKEIVALGKEIERENRLSALENGLKEPVNSSIKGTPGASVTTGGKMSFRDSADYKREFDNLIRQRPIVSNVLQEGVDADGGYLVPTEMENQIVTGLEEYNVVRQLAKKINTSSDRKIPIAATHSVATWTAENAAYTESNPTFDQKTLDAYKLTDLVRVSIELLQDSQFALEPYISDEFARAFGIAEEQAFCVGTGTGQPTGIFTANGGQVGVTTTGATINADNMIDLVHSLKSPYRSKAVFLMNDASVAVIRKLKDQNGAYMWQPSLELGKPDKLLGYPIYTSPYVPAVAAGNLVAAFGDFSNYWIADRLGRTIQKLVELYATNGQIGYIGTQRVDGKVILAEGIKLLKMADGN